MQKLLLFVSILIIAQIAYAQEGVKFQDLSYEEALVLAKKENKPIFLDCYAYWCQPCERMNKTVFVLPEAGEYFNSRFICLKYDMEQKENKELKKSFQLYAYPTFLLILPDGTIQHRMVGACELKVLKQKIARGLNKNTSLTYLNACYTEGRLEKSQWLDFWSALNDASDKATLSKVRKEWLKQMSQEEKTSSYYWILFRDVRWGDEEFEMLENQIDDFRKNNGAEVDALLAREYGQIIRKCYMNLNRVLVENKDKFEKDLKHIDRFVSNNKIVLSSDLTGKLELYRAYSKKNMKYVIQYLEKQANLGKINMDTLAALNFLYWKSGTKYQKRVKVISDQLIEFAPAPYKKQLKDFLIQQGVIGA